MDFRNIKKYKFQIIVSLVFILSLFFPAITVKDYDGIKIYQSYELFLTGPIAFLGGGLFETFIWSANATAFLALIIPSKKGKVKLFFSIISFLIAMSFLTSNEILVSENGRTAPIIQYNTGYWIWILSMAIVFVYNIVFIDKSSGLTKRI